jgi:four helix bundle protein
MTYKLCFGLPSDEKFGMISQLKRASVSVVLNIAEGAARQTNKEFLQFLTYFSGSLSELDTLIEVAFKLEFIHVKTKDDIFFHIKRVTALLNGLIKGISVKINNQ